jgi:hypothetical protein
MEIISRDDTEDGMHVSTVSRTAALNNTGEEVM